MPKIPAVHQNFTSGQIEAKAIQLHDRECVPNCDRGVTNAWRDYACKELQHEVDEANRRASAHRANEAHE